MCTLQGPSPRSPPLGSLPNALRPCLVRLSSPAARLAGEAPWDLPGTLFGSGRLHLDLGLLVRCALLSFLLCLPASNGHLLGPGGPRRLVLYDSHATGTTPKLREVQAVCPGATGHLSVCLLFHISLLSLNPSFLQQQEARSPGAVPKEGMPA